MKHLLWFLLLILLFPLSARATITPGAISTCAATMGGSATCTTSPAMTVAVNDRLVMVAMGGPASYSSTCGITWSSVVTGSGTPAWSLLISSPVAAAGSCAATRTGTGSAWNAIMAVQVYSGVSTTGTGTGITNNSQAMTGNTANCTASLGAPVTGTGNWVLGAYYFNSTAMTITSAQVTAAMASGTTSLQSLAGSTTAQVTPTINNSGGYCNRVAAELIAAATGPPPPRFASLSDQMQSVLIATNASRDYELPNLTLSSTWCAWMMPTGSTLNTYRLTVQSGQNLNGQTGAINMPSWQMTRICQDSSGAYWASPPLIAGTGITLTPSATGTTIAATGGGGGGVAKIAGGTYTLPSGTAFPANSCTLVPTSGGVSAPGVTTADVIIITRQSTASGWGNGSLVIGTIPFSGTFNFEVCNNSANTITPGTTLPMNWLVVR